MNKKLLITVAVVLGIFALIGLKIASSYVSIHDKNVELVNMYEGKIKVRSSVYDNMLKTFSQKWKIAGRVDTSFHVAVNAVMSGRQDGESLMMKWVTEQNPTQQFGEVASMYRDLSNVVEAKRSELVALETSITDIVREQHNLHDKFFTGLFLKFMSAEKIKYTPITSDRMDEINRTSKDNNIDF